MAALSSSLDSSITDRRYIPDGLRRLRVAGIPIRRQVLFGGCAVSIGVRPGGNSSSSGDIQVSIQSERKRARIGVAVRTRTCGEWPLRRGFVHELFPLQDAEAVLLVDSDECETREGDIIFDEGVGADDELRFAVFNALERGRFFGVFHSTDEEFDFVA